MYGKGELTVGSPVPLPNLSPNQEETQVRSDCGKATSDLVEKEEVRLNIVGVLHGFCMGFSLLTISPGLVLKG